MAPASRGTTVSSPKAGRVQNTRGNNNLIGTRRAASSARLRLAVRASSEIRSSRGEIGTPRSSEILRASRTGPNASPSPSSSESDADIEAPRSRRRHTLVIPRPITGPHRGATASSATLNEVPDPSANRNRSTASGSSSSTPVARRRRTRRRSRSGIHHTTTAAGITSAIEMVADATPAKAAMPAAMSPWTSLFNPSERRRRRPVNRTGFEHHVSTPAGGAEAERRDMNLGR